MDGRSGIIGVAALVAVVVFVVLVRRRAWTLRLLDRILRALHWPDREHMSRFGSAWPRERGCALWPACPGSDPGRSEMAGSLIDGLQGHHHPAAGTAPASLVRRHLGRDQRLLLGRPAGL